jgi:signal transduction histidine kinase
LSDVLGFKVRAAFDGPVDTEISAEVADHLLSTLREAVTNIGRHADATEARVVLSVHGSLCRLQVSDNGRGLGGTSTTAGGRGLVNMRRRAEKLGGHLDIAGSQTGGTTLYWQVIAR